mgnify:CR=1 FL=1
MTHQEKLKKVTEAIHKACPDLLELKAGCNIRELFTNQTAQILQQKYKYKAIHIPGEKPELEDAWVVHGTSGVNVLKTDQFKILGQPIGIDSVLRTFEANLKNHKYILTINQIGSLAYHSIIDDELVKFEVWNLTKTLDQQEEPVIDLLHNILCV